VTKEPPRSSWPKRLLKGAGYFLALTLIAFAGIFIWLRGSLPTIDGKIEAADLSKPVDIIRDENAVPHIFAATADDAYFALGFVHAQDRLWQMEMMRRAGAGRLSEILGKQVLPIDKFTRALGFYRTAKARAERLPPDLKRQMVAYAAGVNHYIKNHDGPLSPEFVLLGHTPEPWRAADSLVWSRMMAFRLAQNWWKELFRLRLKRKFSTDRINDFWPSGDDGPITLPSTDLATDLMRAIPEMFQPRNASNAWVLSGKHTKSGKPILANDPHLGFDAPGLWYLARIKTSEFEVTGATVPGVPITVIGHNGTVAWGLTTSGGDSQDLFVETLDPTKPGHYLTPDGSRAFETRKEEIKIKDGDPEVITVRSSRNGLIISDISTPAKKLKLIGRVLALKSAGMRDDDRTHEALYRINRALNWQNFRKATKHFHSPQQNIFYADRHGDIGMIAPARLPVRNGWDGRWPADGRDKSHVWKSFVPFDGLPQSHNPSSGFIGNANNRLVPDSYPHMIAKDWDAPFRAIRLEQLAKVPSGHSKAASARWQMDTFSTAAAKLLPLMLSGLSPNLARTPAGKALKSWGFHMRRNQAAPLIYSAWARHLMTYLMAPYGLTELAPMPSFLIKVLTTKDGWCDAPQSKDKKESCAEALDESFKATLGKLTERHGDNVSEWRWGTRHIAVFKHRIFDHIPIVRRFANLKVATDGGDHTLNRGQTQFGSGSANPFQHRHGAGFRAIYDLADLDASKFIIATGQSGNIFSKFYGNLLEKWRDGAYIPLSGDRNDLKQRAIGTLRLAPVGGFEKGK